jgi:hypothetical protein
LGEVDLGKVDLAADGKGILTTKSLPAGKDPITVSYSGDDAFAPGVSKVWNEKIDLIPTKITLTCTPNPVTLGKKETCTAKVASHGYIPEGKVTFYNGKASLVTLSLSDGAASYSSTKLEKGEHPIHVSFAATKRFAASDSAVAEVKVN